MSSSNPQHPVKPVEPTASPSEVSVVAGVVPEAKTDVAVASQVSAASGIFKPADGNAASGAFKPAASGPIAPSWLARPDGSSRPVSAWLILGGLLLLFLPLLLIELGTPDVTSPDEARALAILVETTHRQDRLKESTWRSFEYWLPQHAGNTLTESPPATLWLQVAALRLTGLVDPQLDSRDMLRASRMVSVLCAVLTLVAVFWAGYSLAGPAGAGIAGLLCVASPLFLWHARLATPTMPYLAAWTMSIAGALWALRPLRPAPSAARQATGWTIAGIGCACAVLAVGPGALLSIGLPILLFVVLCPNRLPHLLGWIAALLVACLTLTPWTIFIVSQSREAILADITLIVPAHWADFRQLLTTGLDRAGYLPLSLGPWVLWIVGATAQPFSASAAGVRVRMFLGWSMFAVALLITLGAHQLEWWSCLAVCVPASALLLAQLMAHYADLADVGRYPRSWRLIVWPHSVLLMLSPLVLGWFLYYPDTFSFFSTRAADLWEPTTLSVALCVGSGGLLLALLAGRWARRDDPVKAMAGWSLVLWVMMLAAVFQLAPGPALSSPLKQDGLQLSRLSDGQPVFRLAVARGDSVSPASDTLSFYADTPIWPVPVNRVGLLQEDHPRCLLLSPPDYKPDDARLENAGQLAGAELVVWRFPAGWTEPAGTE